MMTTSQSRDLAEDRNRRVSPRTPAVLAVGLASDIKANRHGVTRDFSDNGLLIVTPSHFAKGDTLTITVHTGEKSVDVHGRVARVDENPISSPELWRYRVGIELAEPLPEGVVDIVAKA